MTTLSSAFVSQEEVIVFPHPVQDETFFMIPGQDQQPFTFTLTDVNGRVVTKVMHINASNGFRFERGKLIDGVYFYSFEKHDGTTFRGKLILE